MPEEPAFEVQFHVAAIGEIHMTMTPKWLREHRHPLVAHAASQDGRDGLWLAALTALERVFEVKNAEPDLVRITDVDGGLWFVPRAAIIATRILDPTDKSKRLGFDTLDDRAATKE